MGKEDLEKQAPVPGDHGEPRLAEREADAELTDLVAIVPEVAPGEEAQTELEDEATVAQHADDVYVILPEGEAGDIPVVETQVLEELPDPAAETTPLDQGQNVEDAAVLDSNPLADTQRTDSAVGLAENLETQSLDQLESELDADVLAGGGVEPGSAEDAGFGGDTLLEPALADETAFGEPLSREASPFAARRAWIKAAASLAAALLVAAGGYFYFFGGGFEGGLPGLSSGGGKAGVPEGGGGPVVAGPAGGSPGDPGSSAQGGPHAGDVVIASKEAFREKVLLALDLGFGGEVKHE